MLNYVYYLRFSCKNLQIPNLSLVPYYLLCKRLRFSNILSSCIIIKNFPVARIKIANSSIVIKNLMDVKDLQKYSFHYLSKQIINVFSRIYSIMEYVNVKSVVINTQFMN